MTRSPIALAAATITLVAFSTACRNTKRGAATPDTTHATMAGASIETRPTLGRSPRCGCRYCLVRATSEYSKPTILLAWPRSAPSANSNRYLDQRAFSNEASGRGWLLSVWPRADVHQIALLENGKFQEAIVAEIVSPAINRNLD